MAIKYVDNLKKLITTKYEGRVIEIRKTASQANFSDTLDYSDWRTYVKTEALVWNGPVGEFYEQFTLIDCSNIFADRHSMSLVPEVDASMTDGASEPIMWVNYFAWKSYTETAAKNEAEAAARRHAALTNLRAEVETRTSVAAAKKEATKAAKQAQQKLAVTALLEVAPKKGDTFTYQDGTTGQVFWTGQVTYRGNIVGRIGVKNAKGIVTWFPVEKTI